MPGTIRLYRKNGDDYGRLVDAYFYMTPSGRKQMIEIWRRRFCFHDQDGYYLQIAPDVNLDKVPVIYLKKAI